MQTMHIGLKEQSDQCLHCLPFHYVFSPALVAQLDALPTGDQEVAGSTTAKVGNILLWRFDHEIFSTFVLSLPLIQEGQLSVSGERMCTILVRGLSLPSESVVR